MKRVMAGFVKMPGRVSESLLAMQEVVFPRKTLCRVTHLEAMNLFMKEDPSFPLTCYVQDCVCPAEAAPVRRMLQPLPPLLLVT